MRLVAGGFVQVGHAVPNNPLQPATSVRSIPACAGEPVPGPAARHSAGVYPRVCGGTLHRHRRRRIRLGLSPRVRGNPELDGWSGDTDGSIPACAGEPACRGRRPGIPAVYPRVCGGTAGHCADPRRGEGLSPRVRGNLEVAADQGIGLRSIPACAGEPAPDRQSGPPGPVYPRVCGGTTVPLPA